MVYFCSALDSLVGDRYGVRWLDAYEIADSPDAQDVWYEGQLLADLFPKTLLEPGEHSFGSRSVSHYPSMHIDPAIYLRAMMADVRLAGGAIVIRNFPNVEAVVGLEEPLVGTARAWALGSYSRMTRWCRSKDRFPFCVPGSTSCHSDIVSGGELT